MNPGTQFVSSCYCNLHFSAASCCTAGQTGFRKRFFWIFNFICGTLLLWASNVRSLIILPCRLLFFKKLSRFYMFSFSEFKYYYSTRGFFLPQDTNFEFVLISSAWQVITSWNTFCAMLRIYPDLTSFFDFWLSLIDENFLENTKDSTS